MSEKKAFRNSLIKLAVVVLFCLAYSIGGYFWKPSRRFIAPAILCSGMFYFSKDWRTLIQLPLMMVTLSLGYGADNIIWKIIRRFIFGFANGVSSSTVNILLKRWMWVALQVALVTACFVVIGAISNLETARSEELFLGLVIAALPMFSVKERMT